MATSQSVGASSEIVYGQRTVMPVDIYSAAIKGDTYFLVQHLGLHEEGHVEELEEEPNQNVWDVCLKIEELEEEPNQNVRAELQSTTHFGANILHLLVTKRSNNEIALKIFRKEASLLKASNSKLQTPLHVAAKAGNNEAIKNLIRIDSGVVKDALRAVDNNGDTALHTAAKHGQEYVSRELMNFDPEVAYWVNKEGLSPLHITIVDGYTDLVITMLGVDSNLVFTQFSDGMFPIHTAARMGNTDLVNHFGNYVDCVELQDQYGRNLFHIAAAENKYEIFTKVRVTEQHFKRSTFRTLMRNIDNAFRKKWCIDQEMLVSMMNAKDYQGNTPLHAAAMVGAREIAMTIWRIFETHEAAAAQINNQGLTPFQLSKIQLEVDKTKDHIDVKIKEYIEYNGLEFTEEWFNDIMKPSPLKIMDKIQVIGLASVLIATVAFAAAFTFPGGYSSEQGKEGTPLFGMRYMFKTFILANTLAFLQSFASVFSLVVTTFTNDANATLSYAEALFLSSASCMVVAFGSGSYVMLAPINQHMAIVIFVLALLFGSPIVIIIDRVMGKLFKWLDYRGYERARIAISSIISIYAVPFLFIFCLAFLT